MFAPNQDRTHFSSAAKYLGEEDKMQELDQAFKAQQTADFTGGHFPEDNVLAHMRLDDRTGPNGEKILFVEEIQSDWHQTGQKQGYKDGPQFVGKLSAKKMDDGIGWHITDENGTFVTNVLKTEGPGHIQFEPAGAGNLERATIATVDDALSVAQRRIDNPEVGSLASDNRLPDAPLKKTWHEMAFRRIARMAAEEGYDQIAWTPGSVQAERYNVGKKVRDIEVRESQKSHFLDKKQYNKNHRVVQINGKDGNPVYTTLVDGDGKMVSSGEYEGKNLSELVGKELANKILSAPRPKRTALNADEKKRLDELFEKRVGESLDGRTPRKWAR